MWASLHGHSTYSLLDGISQPFDIVKTCCELGIPAFGLTDHGNCAGSIKFIQAKKKYVESLPDGEAKEKAQAFKWILGQEFYIADSPKENSHLVVLAKNKSGFNQLVKASSEATRKENFYRRPRLTIEQLAKYAGDLIVINGHPGSGLYNILWTNIQSSFNAETYEEAKSLVSNSWKKNVLSLAGKYKEIFGENFFIEIQLIDQERLPAAQVAKNILRWTAEQLNIRCVATADSHYTKQEHAIDQRVVLCNMMRTTLPKIKKAIKYDEDIGLGGFFKSNEYYIPFPERMVELHREDEIKTSLEIAESCEDYNLASKPIIPAFSCPNDFTSDAYLTELCREGWKDKITPKKFDKENTKVYAERVKGELEVLAGAGLSDYFLLVKDIVDWTKQNGGLVGPGRGSIGGSLIADLLGITTVDPIEHDLIFERFYNAGRNTKDRISLPDIDLDIQTSFRDKIINYIKEKYGKTKVGKISTYGRMMGRSCLSDVLRAHDIMSFDDIKKCTKFIPDEAAISDDLQEMQEEEEVSSTIRWTLENSSKELKEWCWLTPDGVCEGPLAVYFEQAMRLEGTLRTRGEHAAGVVIFPQDIENTCPIIYNSSGDCVIAYDMHDIETVGGVKFDVLGSKTLDVIAYAQDLINNEKMD